MDFPEKSIIDYIGASPPVAPAEERQLIRQMMNGRRAEARLRTASCAGNRPRLVEIVAAGQAARRRLIEVNGRLVIHLAAKLHRHNTGIPLEELCQEGILGLMRAIDKFDPQRETKLSTYATWWIRQAVGRYVSQNRLIRLPVHQVDRMYRLRRARATLAIETEKTPGAKEIAMSAGDTPENVALLQRFEAEPVSLDDPVGAEEWSRYEFLPGDEGQPEVETMKRFQRAYIEAVLNKFLTAREARILRLRFGLTTGEALTLQEISVRYGLTRERIRQIEGEALRKLRRSLSSDMWSA